MTQKILSPATMIHQQKLKGQLKAKRASIRAIDKGTISDVPGMLRQYARAIEKGEFGDVRNGVLILSTTNNQVASFAIGKDDRIRSHWMVSTIKNRLEPA
jgi:hypothetical protein